MALQVLLVAAMLISLCDSRNPTSITSSTKSYYVKDLSLAQAYKPRGAVGIRYKKQIFNQKDLGFLLFTSHTEEYFFKRKHYLSLFYLEDEFEYDEDYSSGSDASYSHEECPNSLYYYNKYPDDYDQQTDSDQNTSSDESSYHDACDASSYDSNIPPTYLSAMFYKPRTSQILNPFKNETLPLGGIQIQTLDSKMEFPRDNSYVNYALKVKNSYEVPTDELEKIEIESIIEGFLFKKAKTHNQEHFYELKSIMDNDKMLSSEVFQRYTFTYEDSDYISNLTNGMKPIRIQELKPTSSIYRYFTQEIEITPSRINFNDCDLLIPKVESIRIENKQRRKDIEIKTILAASPEISIYPSYGLEFPFKLKSQESIEIKIIYTSETVGLFETVMYIVVDEWTYVTTINANVRPNQFDLEPIYFTDVLINEEIQLPLNFTNPLLQTYLEVEELYSTESFLQLQWPNGQIISNVIDIDSVDDQVQHYLSIPPNSKKHLITLSFQTNQTSDCMAAIHIRTSMGVIIRIPIYFHVHSDILKLTPTVIDFGIVPQNFDMLKMPIKAKARTNEPLIIQDILVPVNDFNLDFLFSDLKLQNSDKNILNRNSELFIGYVLLNPFNFGKRRLLQSKIIIQVTTQITNKTFIIELPIMAQIHSDSNLLGNQNRSLDQRPQITFDVSDFIINPQVARMLFSIPQFKSVIQQQSLYIKNTFKLPISIKGILNNNNQELRVVSDFDQQKGKEIILNPGQQIKLAQVELHTAHLRITSGNKYISLNVNNTLIPISIQIYDKNLFCIWEEDNDARLMPCNNPHDITFGSVAINEPKTKRVNITNMNPMNITFESISKNILDDLSVYVDKIFDKNGFKVQLPGEEEFKMSLLGPRRTKRIVNLTLRPYQTMTVVFQILAKEQKWIQSKIDFNLKGKDLQDFSVGYSYQVLNGTLSIVPQTIRFPSAFPGMVLHKPLTIKSTFEIPLIVKTITSTDPRIFPTYRTTNDSITILPGVKTELANLTFDPDKQPHSLGQNLDNFLQMMPSQINFMDPNAFLNQFKQGPNPIPFGQNLHFMLTNQGNFQLGHANIPLNQHIQHTKTLIHVQDILIYKDKQKQWDRLASMGKTEIDATVTMETNVIQNITVHVKAFLRKPEITSEEEIDFGIVQIGTSMSKGIKIINPTEEPLQVSLFLTTTQAFKQLIEKQQTTEEDTPELQKQWNDKDQSLLQYCQQKMKEKDAAHNQKENTQNDIHSDFLISSKLNQKSICQRFYQILKSTNNTDEIESFKQQIEPYFREMYNQEFSGEAQHQKLIRSIIKADKNSKMNFNDYTIPLQQLPIFNQQQFVSINPEYEAFVNITNQISLSKINDLKAATMMRNSDKHKQGILSSFMEYCKQFLRALFINKHPQQYHKVKDKTQQNSSSKKPDFKANFKLRDGYLNDLIILNDTSKIPINHIDLESQQFNPIYQSYYISHNYQGKTLTVDAKSNRTLDDALIFEPKNLQNTDIQMVLVIKNSLTSIYPVEIKGSGGTGLLEFVKILKLNKPTDSYVNVYSQAYIYQDLRIDQHQQQQQVNNKSIPNNDAQQKETKDKIMYHIYGQQQTPEFMIKNGYGRPTPEQDKVLQFQINPEDILITQDDSEFNTYDYPQEIINNKKGNLRINNRHKRIFVVQNSGNVDIKVISLSIEGKGCQAYGFTIENCGGFTLKAGEQHGIHVAYETDYTIAKVKKNLIIETFHFVQEFPIQVQLPIDYLPIASQIQPLTPFQEYFQFLMKLSVLAVGLFSLVLVSREVVSHFKFKQEQLEQEKLIGQINLETQQKLNQPVNKRELPIIKEMIGHDQVFSMYTQAQEKFDTQNPLLLKEIQNLCSKKTLVCIEAQRQAIDAEKERRYNSRNMTINKYLEKKDREELMVIRQMLDSVPHPRERLRREQEQHMQAIIQQQKLLEEQAQQAILDKQQKEQQVLEQQKKEKEVKEKASTEKLQQLQEKTADKVKEPELKESDSIKSQLENDQNTDLPEQQENLTKESSKDESKVASEKAKQAAKTIRLSKKQKREIDKRQKEQQEAEERFRKLQREREIEEERKQREKEEKEKRRLQKEEEDRRQRELLSQQQELAKQQMESSVEIEKEGGGSVNQSAIFEMGNSLNLSNIVAPNPAHEEKEADLSKEEVQKNERRDNENQEIHEILKETKKDENNESDNDEKYMSSEKNDNTEQHQQDTTQNEIEEQDQISSRILDTEENELQLESKPSTQEDEANYHQHRNQASKEQSYQQQFYQNQQREKYDNYRRNYGGNNPNYRPYYQNQKSQGTTGSYYYNSGSTSFRGRPQGQGYYSQSQGRGQNQNFGGYQKRPYYNQQYEDEQTYYEKRNQQIQPQTSSTTTQPARRVVINTLRTQYPTRGRGGRGYRQNVDFEDEDYHYHNSYNSYNYRKPYSKDDYDDEYYDSQQQQQQQQQSQYYQKRYQRPQQQRRKYDNYEEQEDDVSEQEQTPPNTQKNKEYPEKHVQEQEPTQQKPESRGSPDRNSQRRKSNYNKDDELEIARASNEETMDKKNDKLSKDDLKAFFESQKTHEEAKGMTQRQQKVSNLTSPNQGSAFSTSLFSFNPLNSKAQINQNPYHNQERDISPQQLTSLNKMINSETEEDEEEEEEKNESYQQQTPKQGSSTDFYNAFKSASSLFSKPLFGQTVSKVSDYRPQQQQPTHQFPQHQRRNQIYENDEEEEEEDKAGETSLFSGSLFGDNYFANPRFGQHNQQTSAWNDQRNYQAHQDDDDFYYDDSSNYPANYNSSIVEGNQNQQDYSRQQQNNSLFGNSFGMNYQNPNNYYNQGEYQRNSQNWSDNQFYEDEDEDNNM